MLIRSRLLLLALLPVPVLIGLAALVFAEQRRTAAEAESTLRIVEVAESAHSVAAALYASRDAQAVVASSGERGLESLLLDGQAGMPVPADKDLEDRAHALASAVAAFTDLAGRLGEPARSASARIAQSIATLPTAQEARSLREVIAGQRRAARLLGQFADEMFVAANDPAAQRGLRALGVAERLQNHLSLERLYVRHALITRTLTPDLAREFIANDGELEQQRHELLDLFSEETVGEPLGGALNAADRAGRAKVLSSLRRFAGRQDQLAALNQSLGFGGLIHSFKNFVLRGEPASEAQARARGSAALGELDALGTGDDLSAEDRTDAAHIRDAVNAYVSRLDTVAAMWKQRETPAAIDNAVRYDDAPTIEALTRLSLFRSDLDEVRWDALAARIGDGMRETRERLATRLGDGARETLAERRLQLRTGMAAVGATLMLLALLASLTHRRLSEGIRVLVGELQRVSASGDVAVREVIAGRDELALINASVAAMGRRLQRVAQVAEQMSLGDYTANLEPLSDQDRLAHAMRGLGESARDVVVQAESISRGNYDTAVRPRSDDDSLAKALSDMGIALRRFRSEVDRTSWITERRLRVLESLRNPDDVRQLGERVVDALLMDTGAVCGAFHARRPDGFHCVAMRGIEGPPTRASGGLVDRAPQLAATHTIAPLPEGYLRLVSGLGGAELPALTLTPLRAAVEAVGAIELGWLGTPDPRAVELIDSVAQSIGVALTATNARAKTETLLSETREQARRLELQQEELKQVNEELEHQAQTLRQSEEELKSQREELQTTNEELEEKGELLDRQRRQLERTAQELTQATKYKSEFLANMSHELRTPLNSLLILSKHLADNEPGNLDAEQVEAARVIYDGGRDLLALINDILDLSKVEAGKLEVHRETVSVPELVSDLKRQFAPVAEQKKIRLDFTIEPAAPLEIHTDRQRLGQILRNLLSNALKFTHEGGVDVVISARPTGFAVQGPAEGVPTIAFLVKDTGIGISQDKLDHIFEAFRQADGSTSRKYGGTGLGLSIARQLAGLLGGDVGVHSETGKGSRFIVVLPVGAAPPAIADGAQPAVASKTILAPPPAASTTLFAPPASAASSREAAAPDRPPAAVVPDDRDTLQKGERSVLVIEDDPRFAAVLRELIGKRGFKCVIGTDGRSGLQLARQFQPSAIVLDLGLPDVDGLTVLETLKGSGTTRHIPVHIVSAKDPTLEPMQRGAAGYVHKPADIDQLNAVLSRIERLIESPHRTVLVVEDDRGSQVAIRSLLENPQTHVLTASTGAAALETLGKQDVDCVVLDLTLPDTDGIEFLEHLRADHSKAALPVVVYTGRELGVAENRRLSELAQSIVIKGAASPERLLDEVVLFLHEIEEDLREDQRQMMVRLHGGADAFAGKKLLLVDDDMRNTFALSSTLRKRGFDVRVADNGQLALERLKEHPDTDAVLMDVMMPVMDGLEATRRIREQAQFATLPVIALTARAMVEDRRKCLESGASDYLSKPVDIEELLAMLRIWLGRKR